MAFAVIAGLDYDSNVREFNVRPQPGTAPDVVAFKVTTGPDKLEILDVQPDNQGIKHPSGEVYQWFRLRFANGQEGWLRSHILTIEGDLTRFGYGMVPAPVYAYRLRRVMAALASVPAVPPPAEAPASPPPATPAPVPAAPVPAPAPTVEIDVTETDVCSGTVTAPRGANLRAAPVSGAAVTLLPFEAVVTVLEVRRVPGETLRWVRVNYEDTEGWTREDLLSYSGNGARFGLAVISAVAAQALSYTEYTAQALYPVPMQRYRFIRGFTGPQPKHPGVDYGADDGEPILAGPVGGLVVASKECARCNVPGKPSTVLQGFSLGDARIFSDEGWNFGFGHYIIVRYLHRQLPFATRQALADRGQAGAHIYAMYAHLNRRSAAVGDRLEPGQVFATCGNTGNSSGPHLHLELRASHNAIFPGWAQIASGLIDPLVMFER